MADENAKNLTGGLGGETGIGAAVAAVEVTPTFKHGDAARKFGWWWGTGRRKTAVARVRLRPGSGKFLINGREVEDYFSEIRDREDVVAPLKATSTTGSLDIEVRAAGGGFAGQAGAIKLGVARALRVYDATLEPTLREHNFLTRDSRKVERKKYGQAGARKRFQFSKR